MRGMDQGEVLEIAVEELDNEVGVLRRLAVRRKGDAEEEVKIKGEAKRVVKKCGDGETKGSWEERRQVSKEEERE
jgi:hypothetical protein